MGLNCYQKEIAYIDYYESEVKIKNIGFVRIQQKDKKYCVTVSIKGLLQTDTFLCKIKDINSQNNLGVIEIKNGKGELTQTYSESEMMSGFLFLFSSTRKGKVNWTISEHSKEYFITQSKETQCSQGDTQNKCSREKKKVKKETNEKQQRIESTIHKKECPNNKIEKENLIKSEIRKHKIGKEYVAKQELQKENKQLEKESEYNLIDKFNKTPTTKDGESQEIIGDKWEQLCQKFEKVRPFENKDMGDYLAIEPKDFIVLPNRYQALVNNSFLLHGFYNYRHLILGKMERENQIRYYVGVPGNYYEREKMVAVMFGFEAFEGALIEEVKTGTFGYYLSVVEL